MFLELSRRALLRGSLATASLTALGGLTACGSDGSSQDAAPDAKAPDAKAPEAKAQDWSWTDELGQQLTLDRVPERIVAYGDQAAALLGFGITPVAIFHYMDPAEDSTFEDIDLDGIEVVGTAYGELDLERIAALQPDLVVTTFYAADTPESMYGFKDAAQIEVVRKIAPITGVLQAGTAKDVIATNEKLVQSLGVDTEGGEVAAAREAFEAASAQLTEAAGSGLTVLPVYAEDANLFVAKAPDDPALAYYAELGLQFLPVEGEDYYWETLSWENADKYQPDVVLYSVRDSYTPEQLQEQAVFARLGAVRAGQLHPWKFRSMDYVAQADYLTELAGWVAGDQKVV